MATPDLTKLTDEELEALPDLVSREGSARTNKKGFPLAKAKADAGIGPKAALAVDIEEDEIDGEYIVVNVGANDVLMQNLMNDGGIFKSSGKVRINANRAVKAGGHFEQMEALL